MKIYYLIDISYLPWLLSSLSLNSSTQKDDPAKDEDRIVLLTIKVIKYFDLVFESKVS